MRLVLLTSAAAAVLVGMPIAASAQDVGSSFSRDKNTSVKQRPRPEYEAMGQKMGGFTLYPRATVDLVADDNIYAVAAGETSDTIWRIKPEVALRSNWSRHALGLYASSTVSRYADNSDENSEEYTVSGNGRVDVSRGTFLTGNAQYQSLIEPRTAPTSPSASAEPVSYTVSSLGVSGVKEFNRLRATGKLDTKTFDYDDGTKVGGGPLTQRFRNRDETAAGLKLEYAVSPDTALFVSAVRNTRDYVANTPADNRDSDGYVTTVGANFDLSQALRGEVEAGYMKQSYDNPLFADIDGASARGRVEWFPTELTTVSINGSRSIEEATAAGSQGYVSSNFGVAVDHELMRNLLLGAQAGYGKDDYEGVDRADKRRSFSASGTYLVTRNVGVVLGYSYLKQESTGLNQGSDFTDNKVTGSLSLQF